MQALLSRIQITFLNFSSVISQTGFIVFSASLRDVLGEGEEENLCEKIHLRNAIDKYIPFWTECILT